VNGIKEQTGPAAKAPRRRRYLLRRCKAWLRCRALGLRQWKKRTGQSILHGLGRLFGRIPLVHFIGDGLYALGFSTEYTFVRLYRVVKTAALWLAGVVAAGLGLLGGVLQVLDEELFHPLRLMARGLRNLRLQMRAVRREQGLLAAWRQALRYLAQGIKKYSALVPRVLAYIVPACAALLFVSVVYTVLNYDYTLAVWVNDETVGYVENEQVFDNAKTSVDERINYAGTRQTSWEVQPTYTLATNSNVLDQHAMADAILRASSEEISEATALYLNGNLTAVTTEGNMLREYLQRQKAPYEEPDDPTTRVEFDRAVELVDGVFFTESILNYGTVLQQLSGMGQQQMSDTVQEGDTLYLIAARNGLTLNELLSYNDGLTEQTELVPGDTLIVKEERKALEIRIVKSIVHQEEIPYRVEEFESAEYAFGVTKTVQQGATGLKEVTQEITFDTEGNVLEVAFVSENVLREPVTQRIVKGTKLPEGHTATYNGVTFRWPVPNYTYVSRWHGKDNHRGVDICAPAYTPIIAAASGVVTVAGWEAAGSNYGYSFIINHGNGYMTLYAHCIELYVTAGQYVEEGQVVAGLGSTGRSSGNHLHWEIRAGGQRLPPQNWFGTARRPVS